MRKKKFAGIDEIFEGADPKETSSAGKPEISGEMFKTTIELPRSLHQQVKRYAIDACLKEKQVMALAVQEFIERHQ